MSPRALAVGRCASLLAMAVATTGVLALSPFDLPSASAADVWSVPEDLSVPTSTTSNPQVSSDSAGNAVAVWLRVTVEGQTPDELCDAPDMCVVEASVFDPGTETWSATTQLSPNGQNAAEADVVMNGSGNAMAVWRRTSAQSTLVEARYFNGSRGRPPASSPTRPPVPAGRRSPSAPAVCSRPCGTGPERDLELHRVEPVRGVGVDRSSRRCRRAPRRTRSSRASSPTTPVNVIAVWRAQLVASTVPYVVRASRFSSVARGTDCRHDLDRHDQRRGAAGGHRRCRQRDRHLAPVRRHQHARPGEPLQRGQRPLAGSARDPLGHRRQRAEPAHRVRLGRQHDHPVASLRRRRLLGHPDPQVHPGVRPVGRRRQPVGHRPPGQLAAPRRRPGRQRHRRVAPQQCQPARRSCSRLATRPAPTRGARPATCRRRARAPSARPPTSMRTAPSSWCGPAATARCRWCRSAVRRPHPASCRWRRSVCSTPVPASPEALRQRRRRPRSVAPTSSRCQFSDLPGGITPATGLGAVSMNVTVVDPDQRGLPHRVPVRRPGEVSNVNFIAGQTVANAVIAPVSPSGTICFFSNTPAHVIADINGYFPTGAGYTPVAPKRVADTRPGREPGRTVERRRAADRSGVTSFACRCCRCR